MKHILLLIFILFTGFSVIAQLGRPKGQIQFQSTSEEINSKSIKQSRFEQRMTLKARRIAEKHPDNPRLVAALITVALGPFGAHRLYLGTDVKVPVFYALTLGGGLGILPVVDLICILFTKDLERLLNNPGVFIFTQKKPPAGG